MPLGCQDAASFFVSWLSLRLGFDAISLRMLLLEVVVVVELAEG
jgi:hypothetical protein